MFRKLPLTLIALNLGVPGVMAQQGTIELSAGAGYTLSDGVTFEGVPIGGEIFNRITPKDGASFNAALGYFFNDDASISFLWSRQKSNMELAGTRTLDLGDLNVDNFMGQIGYHFNGADEPVQPYVSLALGATRYGSIAFTDTEGVNRSTQGKSRFSGSLGLGVKVYPGDGNVGLRLDARWTPTYIKSDPGGVWCDPFWGCFATGNPQYSNQFEFSGGLSIRLGR